MKKYKKIVTWEKKPQLDNIIGGIVFTISSAFLISLLLYNHGKVMVLAILFTLMFCFGIRLIDKSLGNGKEKHYILKRK